MVSKIANGSTSGPSAGNLQSYKVFIVSKTEDKENLVKAAHDQAYIGEAPIVMIFCADPKRCSTEYGTRGELFSIQDATIACTYTQLTAHSLGLASVWIGSFDEDKVVSVLKIPNDLKPVAILPIGYPNEIPQGISKRPTNEIVQRI